MYTYSKYQTHRNTDQTTDSPNFSPSRVFIFLFKPVFKFCRDFCLWTSMHGFNHIAWNRRHWLERLLWALATALAIWGALDISLGQLQRYNENPTVVALEKDFRNWKFNLPAITACEQNRVNQVKLAKVIKSFWNITQDHEKYEYYSDFVHTVANSDLYHLEKFHKFTGDESLNVDMFKLSVEVMSDSVPKLTWSEDTIDPPLPSNLVWTPVMIENGACHTINSLAVADIALVPLTANDTNMFPITCKYSRMFCSILMEISTGNFSFYVHSNYDIVDITFPPFNVIITQISSSSIDVSTTRDGRGVFDLAPSRRGCRYTAEPDEDRKVFSTNTCRLSCRSKLAIKLCGCKPFYYFYEEGEQCGVAGMVCLSANAQLLATNAGARCACAQQCVDAVFQEISTTNKFWAQGVLMNRGSLSLVVQAPRTRYTREIIFHFQDLVVSFGGAAGLFLGASFISFVEVLYFFLERFLTFCIRRSIGEGALQRKGDQSEIKQLRFHPTYESARIMELSKILDSQKSYDDYTKNTKSYY